MAALGKLWGTRILARSGIAQVQKSHLTTAPVSNKKKKVWATFGVLASGVGALVGALEYSIAASGNEVHPYKHPWSHNGPISSFDHASIRRGWQVYKEVCAACHSASFLPYRRLVGVCLTEEEAKAEAAAANVRDGPDDTGAYYDRPGRLADIIPSPYPNEEAARHANNGAYPPDLSLIAYARKGGEDYIFALLTGYTDTPTGITLQEGQYFNPYFPGGAISMAQAIFNETVDFEDGTPASASQIAKDVCTFLSWSAAPHHDDRKRLFLKANALLLIALACSFYISKHKASLYKTTKYVFAPKRK